MNNQREAFEKWHKTKYRGLKYNHDSNGGFLNPRTDLDFDIWKSAQTDQSETITKLQLDNAKLREALNYYSDAISIDDSQCECGRGTNTLDDGYKARETLATTSQEKVTHNKPDDYNMVLRREDGLHITLDIANLTITKSGVKQFTLVMGETK